MKKLNFVVPAPKNIIADLSTKSISEIKYDSSLFNQGRKNWIILAFLHLKDIYPSVSLSRFAKRNAKNITHVDSLFLCPPRWKSKLVVVFADRAYQKYWQDFSVFQNKELSEITQNGFFIEYWPQHDIKQRPTSRQKIENVCYFGSPQNNILSQYPVSKDLEKLGLNYIEKSRAQWNDYSDADIVVGIRDFENNTHPYKPSSKLKNTWIGNGVFIGGDDSAYKDIGIENEDYLIARSYDELIEKIKWLKNNPVEYAKIRKAGFAKKDNFNAQRSINMWKKTIAIITQKKTKNYSGKKIISFLCYMYTYVLKKKAFLRKINSIDKNL